MRGLEGVGAAAEAVGVIAGGVIAGGVAKGAAGAAVGAEGAVAVAGGVTGVVVAIDCCTLSPVVSMRMPFELYPAVAAAVAAVAIGGTVASATIP